MSSLAALVIGRDGHPGCLGTGRAMAGSDLGADRACLPPFLAAPSLGAVLCPHDADQPERAGRRLLRRSCARPRPQLRHAWQTRPSQPSSCPPPPHRCGRSQPARSARISRADGSRRRGLTCCPRRAALAPLEMDGRANLVMAACLAHAEGGRTSEKMRPPHDRDAPAAMGSETASTMSTRSRSKKRSASENVVPSGYDRRRSVFTAPCFPCEHRGK